MYFTIHLITVGEPFKCLRKVQCIATISTLSLHGGEVVCI